MALNYTDASGNTWAVDSRGNVNQAKTSALYSNTLDSSSLNLYIGGSTSSAYLSWASASVTANTQTVTATDSTTGITLTRTTYIGDGFVRTLEIVKNTGSAPQSVNLQLTDNVYYDSRTVVTATSSGDTLRTTADDWFAVGSTNLSDANLVHVVSGGAGSPDTTSQNSGAVDQPQSSYNLTLAAGETKVVMHFHALASNTAGAQAIGSSLAGLTNSGYLTGMSATELSSLVNFTQDLSSSVTATLATHQTNLTLTGTAAINGTGNGRDNIITGNSAANTLTGNDGNDTLLGGAGNDTLIGGNGNDTLDGGTGNDLLNGGVGNDLYIVDSASDQVTEIANGGIDTVKSSVNFSIAALLNVENITLTGTALNATGNANANLLIGNASNNVLIGGDGNDTLRGEGGVDTLNGGGGNDIYVVDTTTDIIVDSAGTDSIESSVTFSLGTYAAIENLTLTGAAAINGTGNSLANTLVGNAAANTLDGGAGADQMIGGAGNDTYVVRDSTDVITETSSGGTDAVVSYLNYTLGANLENLTLAGAALTGTGNAGNNSLLGTAGNNILNGLAGNDTLNGGAGIDTLNGGDGNDLYIVDTNTDVITDTSGVDTVQSTVSFSLDTRTTLENLSLIGTGALSATGNALNNLISANAGNSTINGGSGNDTVSYASATAGVKVAVNGAAQVTGGSGTDTLINIENLSGSRFDDALTGDGNANILRGGDGNDTLVGGAGSDLLYGDTGNDRLVDSIGDDTLSGGAGDDTYVVAGTTGSILIEDSSGIDTLDASAATGGVTIDLTPGGTSNINGRMVTLSSGGTVDVPLDVLFLQDASGSFGDDVAKVKTLVPQVLSTLSSVQADNRFGLASFIDKGEYVYRTDLAMTSNQTSLVNALNTLTIGSGGDSPESQIEALMQAAVRQTELGFRPDSFRVAVVMTDADYHKAGDTSYVANDGDALLELEDYPTVALLKAKLLASAIVPVFAVTAGNEGYYNNLVDQLGFGTVVTLAADSSNLVDALTDGMTQITEARIENAIGSVYNDTLIGNGLDNRLEGLAGNDTYYVQDSGDVVVEANLGGTDLVVSSGSYALSANVENLTLSGTANIDATGNALNNQLVGNSGANVISGGAGADRMLGGRGNDTYIVDNAGDQVIEYSGAGTDVIQSSVSFALSDNVENLTLTGTAAINGTGNALGNTLTGNTVANVLNGGAGNDILVGGAGNDTLIGGAGNDTFIFTSLSDMGTTGAITDVINDFVRGQDKIDLGTLDAITSTSFSNEAFSFIGNAVAFTGAGQLRLQDSVLYGNTDTDSEAEFAIKLVGVTTLAATDIIL